MKLYAVGIGPGCDRMMTREAIEAIENSDMIFGYTTYIELVRPLFPEKEFFATPMRSEKERCISALEMAKSKNVAMVCSGDAGVYGMAGLLYELDSPESGVEIEVISGITAAQSGAALLGAPLMQDFAVVSLSDLLVDWSVIEKRLEAVGMGDFTVAIYNPASKKRIDNLKKACDILLKYRSGDTVCGICENIGREGEMSETLTLSELRERKLNMFCTVFIGSSNTKLINGKMVTPRGYEVSK